MDAGNRVLLIGFDPNAIPGVDARVVEMAIAMGELRLKEHGFDTDYCLVAPDEEPEAQMIESLRSKRYDCVVVGGGIRKPEPFLELFERTVNLIRVHAPQAAIAFNTTGENSVEAVLRWLPPRENRPHT
jgi:DNA-binding LacI/PurR family transcriptional regulator